MDLDRLHPLVARWFRENLGEPTPTQQQGWEHISQGRDTLIAAPTGSGKTLAAFTWWINHLIEEAAAGRLTDETSVVYISPLKALGNDIHRNLERPLSEIRQLAAEEGIHLPEIRVAVRSGDTPQYQRQSMIRKPPHILITTPETFFILLTAEGSRSFMKKAKAVIVDEIHAVAWDKRGSHLALSLERFDRLSGRTLQRIGLSATQKPIEDIARLLVGNARTDSKGDPRCAIVDAGHRRGWDLSVWVPETPLGPMATHELRAEVYERIVELSRENRTTLVFVNTRRLAERVAHELSQRLGDDKVAAHHGSLSRPIRLRAERGLRSGEIPVVVATASLELGIDIGHIDLVCHIGAPQTIATLLQRIGRSGHHLGGISKGVLFPLTRDDLVQAAAAVRAARGGELDQVIIPEAPLDILAQQIVAVGASDEIGVEELWDLVRRAFPYRNLTRKDFDDVVTVLADGVATRHGRRSAHIHRDLVNGVLKGRRGARLAAMTSGGAIPDVADYDVIEEPSENLVGKVNEDFAIESMAGDIFLLGNTSWRIRRIESGRVRVEDAKGAPPTIPFWLGEAPARTIELSEAVSEIREEVAARLGDLREAAEWLAAETAVDEAGAEQIVEYIAEIVAGLGCVPTTKRVVAERFFDEAGGMQLVVHSPFGARINRAWGLALRKRFCQTFDFELQAAATDDGIVLSLGEQHSFPLHSIFNYVKPPIVEDVLVQSALASPMFVTRWRWNAARSLALLRFSGGRRVPMPIQRMRAEDLLSAVFPEQVACQEERMGPIDPPDHPLVNETIRNCLHEVMDLDGVIDVVAKVGTGDIETVSVETPTPSAASHEILNANPYAFLDDAPLEERRARAVALRRTDPEIARGVGALNPKAIAEVADQALPDVRDGDELHDLLLSVGLLPVEQALEWGGYVHGLVSTGRITIASWTDPFGSERSALVAAEGVALVRQALEGVVFEPELATPEGALADVSGKDDALRTIVHGHIQISGPVTVQALARRVGLSGPDVESSLLSLEGAGVVLRGQFHPGVDDLEWCERRLLARIHRLTLQSLRREIEPVTAAQFMRFLFRWQHVHEGTQLHGRDGVAQVIGQLQGLELPAPSWEAEVLPARIRRYQPTDLEHLCLSGIVAWGRLSLPDQENGSRRRHTTRNTPLAFVMREDLDALAASERDLGAELSHRSSAAQDVAHHLSEKGPSFLPDIVKATRRFPWEVERALWELVSSGIVTGDGVAGLRHLLSGESKRRDRRLRSIPTSRSRSYASAGLPVGRWTLWTPGDGLTQEDREETVAHQLLRRYGVVFRELLARERNLPPWRALLRIYRRWEAQQQVRGGRFVGGFVGEQFALPEAVEALREVRRKGGDAEAVVVTAGDPLNLTGIITRGERLSPQSKTAILYRTGMPGETGAPGLLRKLLREAAPAGS